jgi:hypothetical protein
MNSTAISMVKNESDIIEYFIRYNLNIFNRILVYEDNSSDNTLEILLNLVKEYEGRLFVYNSASDSIDSTSQTTVSKSLFDKAFFDFLSDLSIPLDADEFIVSITNKSVSEILRSLGTNSLFKISWSTVLLNSYDSELFSPPSILYIRNPEKYIESEKIIIGKDIWSEDKFPRLGNHNLFSKSNGKNVEAIPFSDLKLLHFPVRSKNQFINKIISLKIRFRTLPEYINQIDSNYDYFINEYFNGGKEFINKLFYVNLNYGSDLEKLNIIEPSIPEEHQIRFKYKLPKLDLKFLPIQTSLVQNMIEIHKKLFDLEDAENKMIIERYFFNTIYKLATKISYKRYQKKSLSEKIKIKILKLKYFLKKL